MFSGSTKFGFVSTTKFNQDSVATGEVSGTFRTTNWGGVLSVGPIHVVKHGMVDIRQSVNPFLGCAESLSEYLHTSL